jgi:hypothetical protein
MTISRFEANSVMAASALAGGLALGDSSVQSLPPHAHVSPSTWPEIAVPPNRITRLDTGSKAMLAANRPGGEVLGFIGCHVEPSQVQVSDLPESFVVSKSTRCVFSSKAATGP